MQNPSITAAIEAVRSPLFLPNRKRFMLLIFLVQLATVAIVALREPETWVGWQPSTVAVWANVATLGGPTLAAFSVWVGGQVKRSKMEVWVAAGPRTQQEIVFPMLVQLTLIGVTSWTVGLMLMTAATILRGGSFSEELTASTFLVLSGLAYCVVCSAGGLLLGRKLPLSIALPVSAFATYGWAALGGLFFSNTKSLTALAVSTGQLWQQVRPTTSSLILKALFWLVIAALLLTVHLLSSGFRRPLLWAGSVLLGLSVFAGSPVITIPGATEPACLGAAPQVCLTKSYETVLEPYRQATIEAVSVLPQSVRPHQVVGEPGYEQLADNVLVVDPSRGFTAPALVIDRQQFFGDIGQSLFERNCFVAGTGNSPLSAKAITYWWFRAHELSIESQSFDQPFNTADPTFTVIRQLGDDLFNLSIEQRNAWLEDNWSSIRSCQLSADNFPQ